MSSIKLQSGGQLESLQKDDTLTEIGIFCEHPMRINLFLNKSSLTYLSIQEAIEMRDLLNIAIKEACGL